MVEALVVAVYGRQVVCEQDGALVACNVVGSLLRSGGPLAAGDHVRIERSGDEGIVRERLPRGPVLTRSPRRPGLPPRVWAANVDQVLGVASIREPDFSPGMADRITVAASTCGLRPLLCVNKWDLADDDDAGALEPYRAAGFRVIATSAASGHGIDELSGALAGHDTVAVGHSGVGKSSLLNCLVPELRARVGEVNGVTGRGRHTTTTATWVPLPDGGALVDTPGVRSLGLALEPAELPRHFPEFDPHLGRCEFDDCAHDTEPDCRVREAVEAGDIPRSRYEGYLRIRESLRAGKG
jgi:ribosome biogenesis GTPase / thiamine phosphate phosphatase